MSEKVEFISVTRWVDAGVVDALYLWAGRMDKVMQALRMPRVSITHESTRLAVAWRKASGAIENHPAGDFVIGATRCRGNPFRQIKITVRAVLPTLASTDLSVSTLRRIKQELEGFASLAPLKKSFTVPLREFIAHMASHTPRDPASIVMQAWGYPEMGFEPALLARDLFHETTPSAQDWATATSALSWFMERMEPHNIQHRPYISLMQSGFVELGNDRGGGVSKSAGIYVGYLRFKYAEVQAKIEKN